MYDHLLRSHDSNTLYPIVGGFHKSRWRYFCFSGSISQKRTTFSGFTFTDDDFFQIFLYRGFGIKPIKKALNREAGRRHRYNFHTTNLKTQYNEGKLLHFNELREKLFILSMVMPKSNCMNVVFKFSLVLQSRFLK